VFSTTRLGVRNPDPLHASTSPESPAELPDSNLRSNGRTRRPVDSSRRRKAMGHSSRT
jgi:hypothetical protein